MSDVSDVSNLSADAPGGNDTRAAAARVFAVMRQLVLESDDRRRQVVDDTGLGFARSRALRRLADGPLRMHELAARLTTDRPYTTLIVDDLERRGLVVRTVAADDRRAKVVTLTDAGRALALQAEATLSRPPEAFAKLGADELAELDRLLARLDL
jgi:DNA-binding MarR family transcriptional regulator